MATSGLTSTTVAEMFQQDFWEEEEEEEEEEG